QVELVWQAVSGAASYNVYRGGSPSTLSLLASGVAGTGYDDATAANGTTEFYSVRAVDSGSAQSVDSLVVQATAQAGGWGSGNAGGRLISTIRGIPGVAQPACSGADPLDCSNWSTSATIATTVSWTSGVYLVRLVREDTGSDASVIFVVRDDGRASDLVYGVPLNTYQAYNNYGGKSLYDFNSSGGKAVKVSFNRPYANPGASSLHDW